MAKIYYRLIVVDHKMTLEQVPERWRATVQRMIYRASMGMDPFAETEENT